MSSPLTSRSEGQISCIGEQYTLSPVSEYLSQFAFAFLVNERKDRIYAKINISETLCGFCSERFPLPLGAWGGLRYFIVALPEPSI